MAPNSTIAVSNWRRVARELQAQVQRPRAGADRACPDHEAFLHEPVLGEIQPLAHSAQHLVVAEPDLVERVDRMLEHERVRVLGCAHQADPRAVLVHEEHGRLRRIAVDVRVHQEEVRDVAAGDVPLLTIQHPAIAITPGHRRHHGHVGSGSFLGDGVGVAPFTADGGPQVSLLLILGPGLERDRWPPRDVPQRPGCVPPLLLDQHLLEQVEALATVGDRLVDRVESGVQYLALGCGRAGLGEPVVLLALVFQWDQHVVRERSCLRLQRGISHVESHVH